MAGNGPAPKPDGARRRRNATVPMTKLPREGRKGRIPPYPLGPDIHTQAKLTVAERQLADLQERQGAGEDVDQARLTRLMEHVEVNREVVKLQAELELGVWKELWRTPASEAWQRLKWNHEIGLYVRWLVLGEQGDINAAKEARQLGDRLGLSPLAMLRLRWEIPDDEVGARRSSRTATPVRKLRAVAAVDELDLVDEPPAEATGTSTS
jgi:hypothetical protein